MRGIITGKALAVGVLAGIAGVAAVLAACSSSSSGEKGFGNGNDAGSVSTQAGTCANPTVPIVFSPMYSAYIPGSSQQTFQIPVVTADGKAATWSLSDPSQGNLQTQSFMVDGVNQPGVMITMAGTGDANGDVTVVATESDGTCGSAILHITKNSEDDWTIGNARYNNGVALSFGPPPGFDGGGFPHDGGYPHDGGHHYDGGYHTSDGGSFFERDGGTACTNCHGPTATNGVFNDVSHTPEQTGGFSDEDLANIILNGEVPDGGYFDPSVINPSCDGSATCAQHAYDIWHQFHRWADIDPQTQLPGIICYLRSLAPQPQDGTSNFGGRHHHDGGMPPMPSSDAGTGGD